MAWLSNGVIRVFIIQIRGENEMNFFIQVSNPKYLNRTNDECIESLSDAVEDSFPLNTEDAFLV